MVTVAAKGLMPESIQSWGVFVTVFTGTGVKTSTMRAIHPPRTASHKNAKKVVTHGFLLNTARVRKRKRRDVNTRTTQKKTTASLLSMTHAELEIGAERRSDSEVLVMKY